MALSKNLSLSPMMPPSLVGGIGQNNELDKFSEIFGTRWRITPKKFNWWIYSKCEKVQITLRYGNINGWIYSVHTFNNLNEFKIAFRTSDDILEGVTIRENLKHKYASITILKYLKESGLWDKLINS